MAFILHIESATTMCSVALAQDGEILAWIEKNEGYTHAENLSIFVQNLFSKTNKTVDDLDAIAISAGPGSYTGLRIGVAFAKGICFAINKPLIALNTLQIMVQAMRLEKDNLYCPMIDARRMEVYCGLFNSKALAVTATEAKIITNDSFATELNKQKIVFFGDGATKTKDIFSNNKNAVFVDNVWPSASNMVALSNEKFINKEFENLAYFEPNYLKDFINQQPTKPILK